KVTKDRQAARGEKSWGLPLQREEESLCGRHGGGVADILGDGGWAYPPAAAGRQPAGSEEKKRSPPPSFVAGLKPRLCLGPVGHVAQGRGKRFDLAARMQALMLVIPPALFYHSSPHVS